MTTQPKWHPVDAIHQDAFKPKKIDGKKFNFLSWHKTKAEAADKAAIMKKRGYPIRVLERSVVGRKYTPGGMAWAFTNTERVFLVFFGPRKE